MDGILVETLATLIGIFVGTLAALFTDRRNERRRLRRRARVVLKSLTYELEENFKTVQKVKPAYASTSWGKSFYISTVAWETAVAGGDLAEIIGFELTDLLSAQYGLYVRVRYYVDLLTRLWFAPEGISGYEEIRRGFNRAIVEGMSQAISQHPTVIGQIHKGLQQS